MVWRGKGLRAAGAAPPQLAQLQQRGLRAPSLLTTQSTAAAAGALAAAAAAALALAYRTLQMMRRRRRPPAARPRVGSAAAPSSRARAPAHPGAVPLDDGLCPYYRYGVRAPCVLLARTQLSDGSWPHLPNLWTRTWATTSDSSDARRTCDREEPRFCVRHCPGDERIVGAQHWAPWRASGARISALLASANATGRGRAAAIQFSWRPASASAAI